jgi:hypothetical protein
MTEIPHWRCLLARTWLENGQPDYHVVADGHWLVFDVSLAALYTLTGGEFEPAAPPGRALTAAGLKHLQAIRAGPRVRSRTAGRERAGHLAAAAGRYRAWGALPAARAGNDRVVARMPATPQRLGKDELDDR